ncbi:MAG: DUF378 domain-containing protein [Candidatus Nanohaloarchaea archaeon]
MEKVNYLDWASLVLIIVGAVNWGLVGLGQISASDPNAYNLVNLLLGSLNPPVEAVVYLLVGLSGLYQVYFGYQLYEDQ